MRHKIWWQSTADLENYEGYREAILDHAKSILRSDFEIEVVGLYRIGKGFYSLYFNLINSEMVIKNLVRAEREGFSGAAIGCFVDPGLEEAREVLRIPVAGMGEIAMLTYRLYGTKYAIVNNSVIETNKFISRIPRKYCIENGNCNIIAFDLSTELLYRCFTKPDPVLEAFVNASRQAVGNGSEVIIPGCGIINMLLIKNNINRVEGIPILDTTGILMRMIETMILLREISGLETSEKGFYEPPPDILVAEIVKSS